MVEYLFIPLTGKYKLDEIDYLVVRELLIHPKWRKRIEVLGNNFHREEKLVYFEVLGFKQGLT